MFTEKAKKFRSLRVDVAYLSGGRIQWAVYCPDTRKKQQKNALGKRLKWELVSHGCTLDTPSWKELQEAEFRLFFPVRVVNALIKKDVLDLEHRQRTTRGSDNAES